MSVEQPALSAIVIGRDDSAGVARAVRSILAQHCRDAIQIVVATSGNDPTADIVRTQFPQVQVVALPRPALPGEARNAGLTRATGRFVAFVGSHIELTPGSLTAVLSAHRLGYAMVSGTILNGTKSTAGWASYFLDHALQNLPGYPRGELEGAPVACSYERERLVDVGGFPEEMRAGEDTFVNRRLAKAGYVAYHEPDYRRIHHSRCRSPRYLAVHHFTRGRWAGRLLWQAWGGLNLNRERLESYLRNYVPGRVKRVEQNVRQWAPEYWSEYRTSVLLIRIGAVAAWLGIWHELIRLQTNVLLGKQLPRSTPSRLV